MKADERNTPTGGTARRRYWIEGVVQGVGFRAFVYRIATARGLAGWVKNEGDGVLLEVEGTQSTLDDFAGELKGKPPRMARIESVEESALEPTSQRGFQIR